MSVVIFEKKGKIAYVTINRPEAMNALSQEVKARLADVWESIENDRDIRVAIVSGAGEKAFSAGADLKEMGERRPEADVWEAWRPRGLTGGVEVSKPLIAAINGYCLAGGQELALACDIRIASDTAHFGAPEVKRGILHGYGALRLVHAIPMASAMEMLLTGDLIDAQEALRIGLVSRVVPQAQLMSTAEAIAQRICENSPIAVRAIKDLAYRGLGMPLEQGLRYYAHVNRIVHASEDAREGPRAFAEKRKADFRSR